VSQPTFSPGRLAVIGLLGASEIFIPSIPLQAEVIYSNITGPCCAGYPVAGANFGSASIATAFTPPVNNSLAGARVVVSHVPGDGSDPHFNVSLFSDVAGSPDLLIEQFGTDLTAPAAPLGGVISAVSAARPALLAGIQYWLVLTPAGALTKIGWEQGGFAGAPTAVSTSPSGTDAWRPFNGANPNLQFEIEGGNIQLFDIGTLGGSRSHATAANQLGVVVGFSETMQGSMNFHPFILEELLMIDLGTLGGAFSRANAIDDRGQVVGASQIPASGAGPAPMHAFLWAISPWSPLLMTDLGTLGGPDSAAFGINHSGQIVGYAATSTSPGHAFLWQGGQMKDLNTSGGIASYAYGINDSTQIVGALVNAHSAERAFLWDKGVMTELGTLGGQNSVAYAINQLGQVVGQSTTADGSVHGFLWDQGTMTDLGSLGGNYTSAKALNNKGQIVGQSTTLGNANHAFLWENGVMTDLGTLGGANSIASGVNDFGEIVGTGDGPDEIPHAFIAKKQPH
jgi:probable HAF family extracellular repeat protein